MAKTSTCRFEFVNGALALTGCAGSIGRKTMTLKLGKLPSTRKRAKSKTSAKWCVKVGKKKVSCHRTKKLATTVARKRKGKVVAA